MKESPKSRKEDVRVEIEVKTFDDFWRFQVGTTTFGTHLVDTYDPLSVFSYSSLSSPSFPFSSPIRLLLLLFFRRFLLCVARLEFQRFSYVLSIRFPLAYESTFFLHVSRSLENPGHFFFKLSVSQEYLSQLLLFIILRRDNLV